MTYFYYNTPFGEKILTMSYDVMTYFLTLIDDVGDVALCCHCYDCQLHHNRSYVFPWSHGFDGSAGANGSASGMMLGKLEHIFMEHAFTL